MTDRPKKWYYVKPIGTTSWFKKIMNNYWYPFLTRRWNAEDVVFLNYGYEEDPPMAPAAGGVR